MTLQPNEAKEAWLDEDDPAYGLGCPACRDLVTEMNRELSEAAEFEVQQRVRMRQLEAENTRLENCVQTLLDENAEMRAALAWEIRNDCSHQREPACGRCVRKALDGRAPPLLVR